ncbi:MAG: TlpA disulfide reductase family protein [Rhodothermales bacterium]
MAPLLLLLLVMTAASPRPYDDRIGAPAPPFTGTTGDGQTITLADYRGKVVFLDFWASWCGPCRRELPYLGELKRHFPEASFEVIAINIDDEKANMNDFLKDIKPRIAFPVVFDPEKKLPALYDIDSMPTSLVVDANGVVRYWHSGFKDSDKPRYLKEIETLLAETH